MATSLSRQQKAFLVAQTSPLIIPNTSGSATVTNTNACAYGKLTLTPTVAQIQRPDLTGSRGTLPSIKGRMGGNWAMEMSLASATAGVVPDCDPILQSLFGQAATVVASTSVTYSLSDNIQSFVLFRFRQPSSLTQHLGFGCVVKEATFSVGPDIATMSASGEAVFVLDSDNFGNTLTAAKGGLTVFPTSPTTPVTHGNAVIGFTGLITMDGNTIANLKTATIKITTGNDTVKDTFGSYVASGTEGATRTVGVTFTLDDDDATATQNLKAKAFSQTPVDMSIQVGTFAGNIWTFTLKQVQLAQPSYSDGQLRFHADFAESFAHGTSITANDDVTLTIT